jgi:hypothetical protein
MELILLLLTIPVAIYFVNKICKSDVSRMTNAKLLVELSDGVTVQAVKDAKAVLKELDEL